MIETTMFEPAEDMEMAVDTGKFAQQVEDIDLDLDFVDHAQQDEMMIEESNEISYDLELGDATIEQDAEMTDESVEDFLFDEEIADAPADQIIDGYAVDNAAVPQPDANRKEDDVPTTTTAFAIQRPVDGIFESVQPHLTTVEKPSDNPGPSRAVTDEKEASLHKSGEQEIEELITWESDEEEEKSDTHKIEGTATSVIIDELKVLKPSEIIEASSILSKDDGVSIQDNVPVVPEPNGDITQPNGYDDRLDLAQTQKQSEPEELITYDDEDEDEDEVEENQAHDDPASTNLKPATHTDEDVEPKQVQKGDVDIHEQERALEILHPIVVRYMGEEMSLFPPTIEEEHTIFFLSEKKLAFDTCENLFKAFRKVLGYSISEDESLVLDCPDMGLRIHEGIPESFTLSVAQLLHLHLGLSRNDGLEQPAPLLVVLERHHDISSRLNELYVLMDKGKGLSALLVQQPSERTDTVDPDMKAGDPEEIVSSLQSPDQHGLEDDTKAETTVYGHTTPKYEGVLHLKEEEEEEEEEEAPDFSSPTARQNSSHTHKLSNEAQNGVNLAEGQVGQESLEQSKIAQNIVEEITYDDDEITYDDDDDDEQDLGISNGRHPERSTATIQPRQIPVNTNIQANHETLKPHATNNSEDYLGLDEEVTGPDPLEDDSTLNEDHGEDQKDTALPSTTSVSLADTSVGLNYIAWQTSTPGTMQSLTAPAAADIFDDIGYSDEDEGEPSTISAPAVPTSNLMDPMTIKPPSPKRSIDEVDDLTRESKKPRIS